MDEAELVIHFEGLSAAEAGSKAELLMEALLSVAPGVEVDLMKTDADTMDMGASIILLLGAPAIVAIAKGIANFIARERPGKLVIETRDGSVVFSGDSGDAAKIAAAFAKIKPSV